MQLARVENFSRLHDGWGSLTFGLVNDLVSQVYRENAVVFKDKLNFKMPGGAGFLCHQDATAYATGKLAKHHVSAMVAIDGATVENGCLQVAPGLHNDGVLKNSNGVTCETLESKMEFCIITKPGIVLFDSFLPHKSGPNKLKITTIGIFDVQQRARRRFSFTILRNKDRKHGSSVHLNNILKLCMMTRKVNFAAAGTMANASNMSLIPMHYVYVC